MQKMKRLIYLCIVAALVFACLVMPVSADTQQVVSASVPYDTYVYDYNGNPVITPHAYMPSSVLYGTDLKVGTFSNPTDIEVDKDGNLYVVDTGYAVNMENLTNIVDHQSSETDGSFIGRLVIFNPDNTVKRIITTFDNKGKTDGFGAPEGVTIAHDNTIYVADTMNSRILRFSQDGKLIKEFKEPEISYFDEDFAYRPVKLAVDSSNNMFVIATSVNQGIILLDDKGEFAGFVGAQKVTYSVVDYVWKNLLSEEAQDRMTSFVPTEYNNVKIDDKGFVYTTTSTIDSADIASAILSENFDSKVSPIKRLNPTGNDVLIRRGYFSTVGDIAYKKDNLGNPETSVIEDVALGPNGRYTLLDSRLNRLFTYSSDGELIYAFSADGYQAGNSKTPVSITYRGTDLILLDQATGAITVYETTEYGSLIDEAYACYKQYDYEESKKYWEKVLEKNANFDIAYDGIGNALMQQERYSDAQEYFRYSNNKDRFSTAWTETRAAAIEKYLLLIAAIVIVVLFVLVKAFGWINKRNTAEKYHHKHGTFLNKVLYGFYIMLHPYDGFWDLKHEKRGNAKAGTLIAVFLIFARIISKFFTNYLFNGAYGTKISIMSEILIVAMPLLLWTLSNWCVTTLADGEGNMKDVYTFTCYALLPMALFTITTTILSHFIVLDEAMYITFLSSLSVIWSGYLIFAGNTQTHRYTVGKSILSILMAVLGMAIIVFIALVIFTTYQQIYDFIDSIIKEVTYRI